MGGGLTEKQVLSGKQPTEEELRRIAQTALQIYSENGVEMLDLLSNKGIESLRSRLPSGFNEGLSNSLKSINLSPEFWEGFKKGFGGSHLQSIVKGRVQRRINSLLGDIDPITLNTTAAFAENLSLLSTLGGVFSPEASKSLQNLSNLLYKGEGEPNAFSSGQANKDGCSVSAGIVFGRKGDQWINGRSLQGDTAGFLVTGKFSKGGVFGCLFQDK